MGFQFHSLQLDHFKPFLGRTDSDLKKQHIMRCTADCKPGFPCRVSLKEAEPGETLLLINYQHLKGKTPYQSNHAIFVREKAREATLCMNVIPEIIQNRQVSIRAFDKMGIMLDACIQEGKNSVPLINRWFEEQAVRTLHFHSPARGCYLAAVTRDNEN